MMNPAAVIKHPLSTEKGLKLTETQNTLIFIVDMKANKREIKKAIETMLKVKVEKVNTFINQGKKKAYVKLNDANKAIDIETQWSN